MTASCLKTVLAACDSIFSFLLVVRRRSTRSILLTLMMYCAASSFHHHVPSSVSIRRLVCRLSPNVHVLSQSLSFIIFFLLYNVICPFLLGRPFVSAVDTNIRLHSVSSRLFDSAMASLRGCNCVKTCLIIESVRTISEMLA